MQLTLNEVGIALKSIAPFLDWLDKLPFVHDSKLGPALDWLSGFSADPQGSLDKLKSTDLGNTIVVALRFTLPYLKAYAATTTNQVDDRIVAWIEELVASPMTAVMPA